MDIYNNMVIAGGGMDGDEKGHRGINGDGKNKENLLFFK